MFKRWDLSKFKGGSLIISRQVHSQQIGFNRRQMTRLGWVMAMGGLLLLGSLIFHGKVTTRQVSMPISTVAPLAITVVVDGPTSHPGLIGFLATVHPRTDILDIAPLPGSMKLTLPNGAGGQVTVAAWKGVSMASPEIVTAAIDQATGFTASHYFFMPVDGLKTVFQTLADDTTTWPEADTVSHSLHLLGYPRGIDRPRQELTFLNQLMTTLPQMTPLDASSLMGVAISSSFNLSQYELFILGNYVRGDVLRLTPLSSFKREDSRSRRHHG